MEKTCRQKTDRGQAQAWRLPGAAQSPGSRSRTAGEGSPVHSHEHVGEGADGQRTEPGMGLETLHSQDRS